MQDPHLVPGHFPFAPLEVAYHRVSVDITEFEDLGDRTRVRTRSLFHLPEERDGMLEAGMERGLQESYDRLDEVLARLAAT